MKRASIVLYHYSCISQYVKQLTRVSRGVITLPQAALT
jgi:hypothetical protein